MADSTIGEVGHEAVSEHSEDSSGSEHSDCQESSIEDAQAAFRRALINANRRLAQMIADHTGDPVNSVQALSFAPSTTVAEPKLTIANPKLVEHATHCQRFGPNFRPESWKNIRYSDVKKTFEATPPFSALKVNHQFADHNSNGQYLAALERTDQTLGAITHGLLLQREALQDAFKSLSPLVKKEMMSKVLGSGTKFREISDQLLQYTCGRRAQLTEARRQVYRSTNKALNVALHDIPPSASHLFCEDKLADLTRDIGGPENFLLKKAKNMRKVNFKRNRSMGNRKLKRRRHHDE